VEHIPYLYKRRAASQQSDNPAQWYNAGVSQLELDQKTRNISVMVNLSDAAGAGEMI
jgi:hypothetical protein